ncbi:hypothetical protein [Streptomyces sp. NPDC059788]|uniref:hypothetical protein n=1 Tax=Streptomyces sp. NPDC059788 TaxID=3346948 RepID=UPI0036573D31
MTVAGASIACASGAWFVGDDLVQRVLATGAAAAAVTGSVLLRTWDRTAGRSVAELNSARVRDEWKTDERIAELETDLEESREIRGKLDTKLRSKRAELARLRSEHAELLRRYATAETERASALEGRRLLAIEAGAPARELTSGTAADLDGNVPGVLTAGMYHRAAEALRRLPRNAARQAERAQARDGEDGQGNPVAATESPAAQGRPRTAAAPQSASQEPAAGKAAPSRSAASNSAVPEPPASEPPASGIPDSESPVPTPPGSAAAVPESGVAESADAESADAAQSVGGSGSVGQSGSVAQSDSARTAPTGREAGQASGQEAAGEEAGQRTAGAASGLRPVPPAAASVVAPVRAQRLPASRVQGGFDFFGTATGTGAVPSAAPQGGPGTGVPSTVTRRPKPARQLEEEDLADVVGDEAVAEQSALGRARTTDGTKPGGTKLGATKPDGAEPGESKSGEGKSGEGKSREPKAAAADAKTAEAGAAEAAAAEAEGAEAADVEGGSGEVIDLTAHDETEQIDMAELRSAVSS